MLTMTVETLAWNTGPWNFPLKNWDFWRCRNSLWEIHKMQYLTYYNNVGCSYQLVSYIYIEFHPITLVSLARLSNYFMRCALKIISAHRSRILSRLIKIVFEINCLLTLRRHFVKCYLVCLLVQIAKQYRCEICCLTVVVYLSLIYQRQSAWTNWHYLLSTQFVGIQRILETLNVYS